MTALEAAVERAWGAFREALESGNDADSHAALRGWIDAWDRCVLAGELGTFDVAYHDDVRARSHLRLPGMISADDLEGLKRGVLSIPDVATRFRFDVTGFERAGSRFIGSGTFRARGRYSGLLMRLPMAVLWGYRDGRIATIDAYGSRRAALGALRDPAGVAAA